MCQNMVKAVDARGTSESSRATGEEIATATRCADMILQAVDKYCNNFETYDATRCAHVRDDPSFR